MRHFRMTLGLAAVACVFAVAATPALAHEFTASKTAKTSSKTEEEQNFTFGPIKISCLKATAKGAVALGSSSTNALAVKFSKCATLAKIGAHTIFLNTAFKTPLAIEYHANGFVETGSELEEIEGKAVVSGGEAEIKINTGKTEEREKSTCVLHIPEQTIPLKAEKKPNEEYSVALYSNVATPHATNKSFPDGLQHSIEITNAFKGIHYELEGEPCEEWGRQEGDEGFSGQYKGTLPEKIGSGNLEFN
jgi:hypothetical protein